MKDLILLGGAPSSTPAHYLKKLSEGERAAIKGPGGVYMSFQGTGAERCRGGTLRHRIMEELSRRHFIIYVDHRAKATTPIRVYIYPEITAGELGSLYRSCGRPSKLKGPRSMGSFAILSSTTKMGCLSFNLPPGPLRSGGACPAADLGFMYNTNAELERIQGRKVDSFPIDVRTFICNGCYAGKGSYGNPSNVLFMQARYMLVQALIDGEYGRKRTGYKTPAGIWWCPPEVLATGKGDPPTRLVAAFERGALAPAERAGFSGVMAMAIQEAARVNASRRSALKRFGFSTEEFIASEGFRVKVKTLGAIAKKYEISERGRKHLLAVANGHPISEEAAASLHGFVEGGRLTERGNHVVSLMREIETEKHHADYEWQVPDPGYFRIHDAGDFWSEHYLEAWLRVCRKLSHIKFWAPTRAWAMRDGVLTDALLKKVPSNLALRPSTLHFGQQAPTAEYMHGELGFRRYSRGGGLSAPSGSARGDELPGAGFRCPAYMHWTYGGGALERRGAGSKHGIEGTCILAVGATGRRPCRACWTQHNTIIFYEEH